MTFHRPTLKIARAGLLCAALLVATTARAAEARFSDTLTPEEKAATGFTRLTPKQSASLDGLVAHDATLARQGGVTGFSSAFSARHTASERASAGLDGLSASEREVLDTMVARAIALGPPPDQGFTYSPAAPSPTPSPVPPPSETTVSAPLRAEIHGDLSFVVGGGSHRQSFYGTSADFTVTDPSGNFTLGVGFEELRGKGIQPFYGPCGPYSLYGPYAPLAPFAGGPAFWGW
jgi:hypothetical protein